jgi:hypothetical protein
MGRERRGVQRDLVLYGLLKFHSPSLLETLDANIPASRLIQSGCFAAGYSKLALGIVSRSKPRKLTLESHRAAETELLNLFTRAASSVTDVPHDVSIARCSRRQTHRASLQFLAAQTS